MVIIVSTNEDWSWLDAMVIDTLVQRGFNVTIVHGTFTVRWYAYVPEWVNFLSAVQHVYTKLSRGSERCWPLKCHRKVVVHLNGKDYDVEYWVKDGGLAYGSISV